MIKSPTMKGNFKYYKRLFGLYVEYIRRKTVVKNLPVRLWIELSSECNLKCVMCPNKDLPSEQKGYMDFEVFKKLVDEAQQYIFDVSLLHRGESLLHPEFVKFLHYVTKYEWRTKLHTNGTVLTKELSKEIIKSGLYRISFSFDGYSPKTYEKIRVGAKFNEVVENIKNLLILKKEMNSKYPIVAIELIDFPNSEISDIEKRKEFLKNFEVLNLNELVIKKIHNWAGYVRLKNKKIKFTPCTFLWHGIIVLWNGRAMPCSQDFFEYYPLENIKDMSLKEIWNGKRLVNLREKHVKKDIADLETCNNCDRVWRKTFMGIPTEYLFDLLRGKMP